MFGEDPDTKMPIEIIGIVRDAKYTAIREPQRRRCFSLSVAAMPRDAAGNTVSEATVTLSFVRR
ncbi:MAG TPA: hypothetical protein VE398_20090 [Acidobacteriota bacterium]|nr:hypothetical protein [Acidobacteriota bacterium]